MQLSLHTCICNRSTGNICFILFFHHTNRMIHHMIVVFLFDKSSKDVLIRLTVFPLFLRFSLSLLAAHLFWCLNCLRAKNKRRKSFPSDINSLSRSTASHNSKQIDSVSLFSVSSFYDCPKSKCACIFRALTLLSLHQFNRNPSIDYKFSILDSICYGCATYERKTHIWFISKFYWFYRTTYGASEMWQEIQNNIHCHGLWRFAL